MRFCFNDTKINSIFATSFIATTKISCMKFFKLFFLTLLFFFTTKSIGQSAVSQIFSGDKSYFITNRIGYPISGTYLFEGKTPPVVILNDNGTGIIQDEDLKKTPILWGIQCSKSGTPKFKKGFDSAKYTIWYQNKENEKEEAKWVEGHFSIHFNIKKMFVSGNRSKTYVDKK